MIEVDVYTHDDKVKIAELKDEERQPCEVWTRVMGYYRPTSGFNVGKKQEFADRKYFSEKVSMTHCEDAKDKVA
jgi:hypothetical protein